MTTLRVFRLHLSLLLPREWWGRAFLNHSNIEAVLNKLQPGDSPRKTKQTKEVLGLNNNNNPKLDEQNVANRFHLNIGAYVNFCECLQSLKTRYTSVFPSTILRSPFPFCSPFPHRSAYLLDELTKYGTKTDEERNIMMRRTVPCAMKIRRRNISSYNRKTDEWPMVIIQKSGLSWGCRLLDETRQSWRQGSGGNNTWQTPIIRPLTMYRQTSLN